MILLLISMFSVVHSQRLSTQLIGNESAIIELKLGNGKIIDHYQNLIHIIDINDYINTTENIKETLNTFEQDIETKDSLEITKLKLNQLRDKIDNLSPFKRRKRGLFNGLGSAIKYITGNMDDNDAKTINSQLRELIQEEQKINKTLTKQTTLNTEMIQRFNNITTHINNEQNKITRALKNTQEKFSNRINKENNLISKIQYLNRINYNIDLLTNQINNIAESIVLAKLNIISKFILNHKEIENIYELINDQIHKIYSVEQLYEILELQAYHNNSNIIFNIKIPRFQKETFIMSHIIPLTINVTRQIVSTKYIAYNNNSINYYQDKCLKLQNIYVCRNPVRSESMEKSSCMGNLIRKLQPRCKLRDVGRLETIYQPEDNFILFINIPTTLVESDCSKPFNVSNTTLLYYEKCTITINGLSYEDKPQTYKEHINVTIPKIIEVIPETIVEELNLQKLKAYQFSDHDMMSSLKITTTTHQYVTYTSITIIILIIVITSTCLAKRIKITYTPNTYTIESIIRPPANSLWPSLYSKGGGVTYGHQSNQQQLHPQ